MFVTSVETIKLPQSSACLNVKAHNIRYKGFKTICLDLKNGSFFRL